MKGLPRQLIKLYGGHPKKLVEIFPKSNNCEIIEKEFKMSNVDTNHPLFCRVKKDGTYRVLGQGTSKERIDLNTILISEKMNVRGDERNQYILIPNRSIDIKKQQTSEIVRSTSYLKSYGQMVIDTVYTQNPV